MATQATLIVPTAATVGQHDANMVLRFGTELRSIWAEMHSLGRSSKIGREGQYRIHQILGSMGVMWTLMEVLGTNRLGDPADASLELLDFISEPGVRASICSQACFVLSQIANRQRALGRLSRSRKAEERFGCAEAARKVDLMFWRLLGTGVLAEMPNSPHTYSVNTKALERYGEAVTQLWSDVETLKAGAPAEMRLLLGRVTGLGLFEGVRAQLEGRTASGVEGLVKWYRRPHNRNRRGFFAVIGLGVHDLSVIASELQTLGRQARTAKVAHDCFAAAQRLREAVYQIFMTGILSSFGL